MRDLVSMAECVATTDCSVLLVGETGVGKERLATFIHGRSPRQHGEFLAINCGALTEGLLESELFGHRRGAFTGAVADRQGLFEAAQGGTVLLDEIGEMRVEMQASLLRVLQEREIRRIGDTHARSIDVRMLAATNRDLTADIQTHRFREDLYYRLSVFVLRIPPLRERPEDLCALIDTLLTATARRLNRPVAGYSARARKRLLRHPWPGNIRELQNAIEHAFVLSRGATIDLHHLPDSVRDATLTPVSAARQDIRPLKEIEREHILSALAQSGGNRRLAAARLQIGIATLQRKLRHYSRTQ